MSFDPQLLEHLLVCPRSHGKLVRIGETLYSTDPTVRLKFAIIDQIPNMLIEEAATLTEEEWRRDVAPHLPA